jgi:hypothetical protein
MCDCCSTHKPAEITVPKPKKDKEGDKPTETKKGTGK